MTNGTIPAAAGPADRRRSTWAHIHQALRRRGWLAVVALRLVPAPFSAVNLAAGLTSLRLRSMAIGTLIGGAPKALGWAALGLGATRLPAVSPFVIAAVIVASLALTVVWLRWRRPRSAQAHPQPAPANQLPSRSTLPASSTAANNTSRAHR